VAKEWCLAGPRCVIVTSGSEGSVAYRDGHLPVKVCMDPVKLVDAVGAGDSYMGALLVHLQRIGAVQRSVMDQMTVEDWTEAMRFAARVAAINCTRAGCDPPTIAELDQ